MALRAIAALGLASVALAAPKSEGLHKRWLETRGETLFNVFKRDGDSTSLAYVENSGICVSDRSSITLLHQDLGPETLTTCVGDHRGSHHLLGIPGRRFGLYERYAHVVLVLLGPRGGFHCPSGALAQWWTGLQQHVRFPHLLRPRRFPWLQMFCNMKGIELLGNFDTDAVFTNLGSVFSRSMVCS